MLDRLKSYCMTGDHERVNALHEEWTSYAHKLTESDFAKGNAELLKVKTAMGLVVAIPAVVIYNAFSRAISTDAAYDSSRMNSAIFAPMRRASSLS